MPRTDNSKPYDLEERTFQFAKASRVFVKQLPRTIASVEDAKQFVPASGSIGANYIEANESIGKKDFVMKSKPAEEKQRRAPIGCACLIWMASLTGRGDNLCVRLLN